jgi:hypothetical protein
MQILGVMYMTATQGLPALSEISYYRLFLTPESRDTVVNVGRGNPFLLATKQQHLPFPTYFPDIHDEGKE